MALDLEDKTANNNDLTNNGAAEYTADTPFAASTITADLELSEGDYLEAADSASLSFTSDFTIEFWLKPESNPANEQLAIYVNKSTGDIAGSSYNFNQYNQAGTPKVGLTVSDGTNQEGLRITHTPTLAEWHHYAATWTASTKTCELFRDGTSLGTAVGTNVAALEDNTTVLRIGSRSDSAVSLYDGVIDEVRIWNDKRTDAEIADNRSIELTGTEANLVAYWPFETAIGTLGFSGHLMMVGVGR